MIRHGLIIAALALVWLAVSTADRADAESQRAEYCDMVAAGYWPAFAGDCTNN